MNPTISETLKLPNKDQLKAFRKQIWKSLLLQNDLDLDLGFWFTESEKSLEQQLWVEADEEYEARKAELKAALKKLSKAKKGTYLEEIGLPAETNVDTYLAPSPAQ